jgi:hypothetical protein
LAWIALAAPPAIADPAKDIQVAARCGRAASCAKR